MGGNSHGLCERDRSARDCAQLGNPGRNGLARARREGWTREIQSAKALGEREDAEKAISPLQAVAMSIHQRADRHVERMAGVSEKVVAHVESLEPSAILDQIDKVEKADRVARRT